MNKDFINERLKEITDMPDSTMKVDLIRKTAIGFWREGLVSQGIVFNNQALDLAGKLNYKNGIAQSYSFIGYTAIDTKTAIKYYYKALEIYEEINNVIGITSFYNNMGLVYKKSKNFDIALNYFFKALKIKQENNINNPEITYSNIANCYYELKFYDESLKYHRKSLEECLKKNDNARAGYEYTNIANILFDNLQYDDALECIENAELLNNTINHKSLSGIIYYNKGRIFHSLGYLDSAAEMLKNGLELIKNTEHYSSKLKILHELVIVYQKKNEFKTALEFSLEYINEKEIVTSQEIGSEVKSYIDVTEYEKYQHEISKRESEIKKVKTIGDFAFGISEKLNQPLTTLLLKLDYLRLKAQKNNFSNILDYQDDLDIIHKQANKIDSMLKQIQNLMKFDSDYQFVDLDLTSILNKSLEKFHQSINLNHIQLNLLLPKETVTVFSIASHLEIVLFQLIKNAIDSLKLQYISNKKIEISVFMLNKKWVLKIFDNGGGIEETELVNLFKPFYTTLNDKEAIGLGLTISQTLCNALGIDIEIENKSGESFSVLLYFPDFHN